MKSFTPLLGILSVLVATFFASFPLALAAPQTPVPKTATKAPRSWLRFTASTDKQYYSPGQPIKVLLTAAHNTYSYKHNIYLGFSSEQRFDLSVYRKGEQQPTYTWSAARTFAQSAEEIWLKRGQKRDYQETIGEGTQRFAPGIYVLRARLTNSPRPFDATPVTFRVVDLALSMTARTDKATYKIGEPVRIDAAVTNLADRTTVARFGSGFPCEFVVSNEAGRTVWYFSANLRFDSALGAITWKKGETKNYTATWNGMPLLMDNRPKDLAPGRYKVQAILQSTPDVWAPPVLIELVK